jgi:hypothetical protein
MVTFKHASDDHSRKITKLGIVGAGQVVREKLGPAAMQRKGNPIQHIAVCSLEAHCPLEGFANDYRRIETDSLLPMDYLYESGLLSPDSLWIIATPSQFHIPYAL